VVTHGNTAQVGSGVVSTRRATIARRGLSGPAATGAILNQTFNGNGFPSGWQQFLPGVVGESPKTFLTITDSTGRHAGIASNPTKTVPFNPMGVVTTMTANISNVSTSPQLGNAIVGLLGLNGTGLAGELAAGIDGEGNVFVVEYDSTQDKQPNVVLLGTDKGYNGLTPVNITFTINTVTPKLPYFQVTAGAFNSGKVDFANALGKFSMNTAFPNGAVPALVAASQQGQSGGAASFESISVSTA
jgi:hypothetical protein